MINSYFSITNITLSPDSSKLLLKITPIFAEITAEDIILFLQSSELPQFKVNHDGIKKAVDAFASLYNAGNPDSMKFEPIVIADKKDALLNVDLSTDKMRATANITAAYGGKSVNVFDVKSKCEQLGIKFGLLTKNILGLINISKKAAAGKILKIDIAKGEDPIDGHDAQFTMNVNTENQNLNTLRTVRLICSTWVGLLLLMLVQY